MSWLRRAKSELWNAPAGKEVDYYDIGIDPYLR